MKTGKNKDITRRDFMKKAGIAGAALGAAAVVPSFAGKAFAAKRDFILIGHPSPLTGPLAGFGETAKWVTNRAAQEINQKGGFYIKELGKHLPIKIKQLEQRKNKLEQIILQKLQQEAKDRLPKIDKQLSQLEDKKAALEKNMLTHSVFAEVIDHYINAHPNRVYRDSIEHRKFCELEKPRVKKELGIDGQPNLIEQKSALLGEKNQIQSKVDYSDDFSQLIEKLSNNIAPS